MCMHTSMHSVSRHLKQIPKKGPFLIITSHFMFSSKNDNIKYSKRACSENLIQHPWYPTFEQSYTQFFGLCALVPPSIEIFGVPKISACDLPSLCVLAASRHWLEPPTRCRACSLRFTSPFPSLPPTWIRHGSPFCEDLVTAAGHHGSVVLNHSPDTYGKVSTGRS
jgi:hypothetical protein